MHELLALVERNGDLMAVVIKHVSRRDQPGCLMQ
jgi:hypothetical protein